MHVEVQLRKESTMNALNDQHLVTGVDHVAFPTFDPAATVRFYRDTLGFPVVHSICAAGWGPDGHPDFIHFFFDIGHGDRLAFFYYFGLQEPDTVSGKGDVYARFAAGTPDWFVRSRHLALHVRSPEHLLEYRRRLDASDWPVEMQIQHETIESVYTHDPNGYMVEITRALRPVTPQEDLDANLTIDALVDISGPGASMDALLVRKAELIVQRAEKWQQALDAPDAPAGVPASEVPAAGVSAAGGRDGAPAEATEGPVRS
jgi:catechol 2,3-dioxygenase-like lactoylglutathione lyase family enzyme